MATLEREAGKLPGDVGMWVFVLGDFAIFSVYFIIFMIHRSWERDVFLESQHHLNAGVAAVNTLVLLTGSWLVARAVRAARAGDVRGASVLVRWTIGCGVLFGVVKVFEWWSEISRGFTLPRNDFFMFYYMLTGVHLFHVALGVVVLGVVLRQLRGGSRFTPGEAVATGATYWHMVDLLWIMIFALVYVLR